MLVEFQPSVVVLGVGPGHTSVYACFSDPGMLQGGRLQWARDHHFAFGRTGV
jgi:hypothetical protein